MKVQNRWQQRKPIVTILPQFHPLPILTNHFSTRYINVILLWFPSRPHDQPFAQLSPKYPMKNSWSAPVATDNAIVPTKLSWYATNPNIFLVILLQWWDRPLNALSSSMIQFQIRISPAKLLLSLLFSCNEELLLMSSHLIRGLSTGLLPYNIPSSSRAVILCALRRRSGKQVSSVTAVYHLNTRF